MFILGPQNCCWGASIRLPIFRMKHASARWRFPHEASETALVLVLVAVLSVGALPTLAAGAAPSSAGDTGVPAALARATAPSPSGPWGHPIPRGSGEASDLSPASARTLVSPASDPGSPPHPLVVPASGAPSFTGHYYAGSVFSGVNSTANNVAVSIRVPDDRPQGVTANYSDFYYVILSLWDNAGSYDQIGFTNDGGTWGIAFSWTNSCAGTYYYSPDVKTLSQGQTYLFDMAISAGTITFSVNNSEGTNVWHQSNTTGGTEFEIAAFYTCGTTSYYDYTDYEEVYATAGPLVPYELYFTNNLLGGSDEDSWTGWNYDAPSGVTMQFAGANVTIVNEPYEVYFPGNGDATTVAPTDPATPSYWNVSVRDLLPDTPINLSAYYAPTGWLVAFDPGNGSPPFGSELQFTIPYPTSPATYYIGIEATDGSGSYSRIALNVTVPSFLAYLSASPASGGIDVHQSVRFTASVVGGTGGLRYGWPALPPGCGAANASSISCAPSSAGTFGVTVEVTDSADLSTNASISYVVDTAPSAGPAAVSRASLDIAQAVTFTANVSGGAAGGSYVWSFGALTGCTPTLGSVLACTPGAAGSFSVSYAWTDANGAAAPASPPVGVTVYAPPAVTVPVPSRSGADVGQALTFSSTLATPGSGGVSYAWSVLPSTGLDCSASTGLALSCAPAVAGNYTVALTATDGNGGHTNSSVAFEVWPSLAVGSLVALPASVLEGASVRLAIDVGGGRAPYRLSYAGLPSGCGSSNSSSIECASSASGTFTVTVTVVDANGVQAISSATFTVRPAFLGLPAAEGYAALGVGLAIAALVAGGTATVLLRRRRRRSRPDGPPEPPAA